MTTPAPPPEKPQPTPRIGGRNIMGIASSVLIWRRAKKEEERAAAETPTKAGSGKPRQQPKPQAQSSVLGVTIVFAIAIALLVFMVVKSQANPASPHASAPLIALGDHA